jgi:hypothetical protein
MRFSYAKEAIAALWVLALCAAGFAAGITAISSWVALATLAVVSLVMMQWFWRDPPQTMSESIRQARR